jgi:hypothetical protein
MTFFYINENMCELDFQHLSMQHCPLEGGLVGFIFGRSTEMPCGQCWWLGRRFISTANVLQSELLDMVYAIRNSESSYKDNTE